MGIIELGKIIMWLVTVTQHLFMCVALKSAQCEFTFTVQTDKKEVGTSVVTCLQSALKIT